MKEYFAYIDESGDPDFNEHSSEIFFICAIIFDKELYENYSKILDGIKKQYKLAELKSASKLSSEMRFSICSELLQLDFRIVTIWVIKRKLSGDWFKIRKTFYKYIQRRLNHEVHRLYDNVQVYIDQFGSPLYQESLKKYLITSLQEELFEPSIQISSHKYEQFIQVSDFIAGCLRKSLNEELQNSEAILNLFKPRWDVRISIPDESKYLDTSFFENNDDHFDICLKEANRYLTINSKRGDDPKVRTLEYLYYSSFESPNAYIFTSEIISWLSQINMKLTEEQFRTEVIASLRDEGLIIVGTRKGLKIPTKLEDFVEYINFSTNLALPILKRLKRALVFISAKTDRIDFTRSLNSEMKKVLDEINT